MEFKFRSVDNVTAAPTSHSPSPVTYLPDRPLQMDGGFPDFRLLLTGEAALHREVEKEHIRREILRRLELEEEVRRELAIERKLGISIQRPLNIQGLMPQWSNSTVMSSVALGHIGASQPSLILPPTEISDKDKVIVLAKPDPELYNAKRKAAAPAVSETETEPSAFDLKKKLKQEWSCELCGIKATSESGLNAHLNGKKHKTKEARQNRKICESNKKSEKIVNVETTDTVVTSSKLGIDGEKYQNQQHPQPCMALEFINETIFEKGVKEIKKEEQLVELLVDKSQCLGFLESNKEEAGNTNALTKRSKVEHFWCEVCQINTTSKVVMEGHIKGKKHTKKMKKFEQDNVSPPFPYSISQQAP